MEKTLEREIKGIEITDELIALNKEYSKLDRVYKKYEELIDTIKEVENIPFYNDNDQTKILTKQQNAISKRMDIISEQIQKDLLFIRMGKAAMFIKALKETK